MEFCHIERDAREKNASRVRAAEDGPARPHLYSCSVTYTNNREPNLFSMSFLGGAPVNSVHNKSVTALNVSFFVRRSR